MPMVLVTGLPGHGKTLYALQWVEAWATREGRAVFHNGINGLTLNWQQWKAEDWQELEPGSIVVLDECQAAFPVRGRGQPAPWIEELAKHRHRGIDFVLITQNPMLMDSFVRRLVDRHFHIVRKFGTHFATVYEYPNGVRENVATSREGGIRHEWKYPTDVFNWYKSAELHTVKRRVPARVFVLLAIPFVFIALAWVAYSRLNADSVAERTGAPGPGRAASAAPPADPARPGGGQQLTAAQYVAHHQPRVAGLAYTAPAYDGVTVPVEAPYPAACIASASRCQCYTQQGTRLSVAAELCAQIADGGFFVAWSRPVQAAVAVAPAASAGQVQAGPIAAGFDATRPRPAVLASSGS